jgi:ATP synthase protein I
VGAESGGPPKVPRGKDPTSQLRLTGLGFELVAAIAGGALLGWWIDKQLDSSPKWLITLSVIGIVGGLYNLIRSALSASRDARVEDEGSRDER